MSETIRYAMGRGSMGVFLAASSQRGLIAFEFTVRGFGTPDALRERFPDAAIEEDASGLAGLIGKLATLVDHPANDPAIALDPRGSDYQLLVWSMLRDTPGGETTSYGALAGRLGTRDARDVTAAIAANTIAILIPCHRVVKKDGSLSGYRWGASRKRILLQRESEATPFPVIPV